MLDKTPEVRELTQWNLISGDEPNLSIIGYIKQKNSSHRKIHKIWYLDFVKIYSETKFHKILCSGLRGRTPRVRVVGRST